jgi:hypothetical protein
LPSRTGDVRVSQHRKSRTGILFPATTSSPQPPLPALEECGPVD